MSRFHEGPASGQSLLLRRAPLLLRVVIDAAGKVDALDQLADTPAADETIHVYERQTEPTTVHMNFGRGKGGWYKLADYVHLPQQPADHEIRTTGAWREWTRRFFETHQN